MRREEARRGLMQGKIKKWCFRAARGGASGFSSECDFLDSLARKSAEWLEG